MPHRTCLRTLCFLCLLQLCTLILPAQTTCIPVYIKEYLGKGHTEPYDIKYLADGTSLVAGRGTISPSGDYDGFVSKISSNGTIIWSYLIGGSADDRFTGICPLSDGTFILYGTTTSNGNPSGKTFIVHINTAGSVINSYQVMSAGTSSDRPKKIIQFSDGELIGTINLNDSTTA